MATKDKNIQLEVSNSGDAKSRDEDSDASNYGVFTYSKQQTADASKQMRIHMPNLAKLLKTGKLKNFCGMNEYLYLKNNWHVI